MKAVGFAGELSWRGRSKGWGGLATGAYKKGGRLLALLVDRPGSIIRRIAGGKRARQMQLRAFCTIQR